MIQNTECAGYVVWRGISCTLVHRYVHMMGDGQV